MPKVRTRDPLTIALGNRVRLLRKARGISQEKLGDQLGLTFQQIQKYEKGTNRITFSCLVRMAHIFGLTVPALIEGIDGSEESLEQSIGENLLAHSGATELVTAFSRIKDKKKRSALLELTQLMGDAQQMSDSA